MGQPTQTRTPIKTTPPEVYSDGEPIEINGNYDPPGLPPITIRLKIGGVIVATDTATSGNGVFAGTLTVPDVEEATLATVEVVANGKIQAFVPIDIAND